MGVFLLIMTFSAMHGDGCFVFSSLVAIYLLRYSLTTPCGVPDWQRANFRDMSVYLPRYLLR